MMRSVWVALAVCLWAAPGGASPPDTLSAAGVLERVKDTFGRIEDYRVRIGVHVDIEGFPFPDREVALLYKRPARVHLEGGEFAMLPRQGVMADPSQLLDEDRFDVALSGLDNLGERPTYRLTLTSRADGRGEGRLIAWVDAERWVVVRMEAFEGEDRQGVVRFEHALVAGRFWLPQRTDVEISMENLPMRPAPRDTSTVRQPEKGTIRLDFYDYEVNVGLPDSLFADPQMEK